MSESTIAVEEILAHYGTKGMKWGTRKSRGPTAVTTRDKTTRLGKTKVKTKGGENRPSHADARNAQVVKQVLKKSGLHALSNQELRDFSSRINLEQSAAKMRKVDAHPAKKWIAGLLKTEGQKAAQQVAHDQTARAVSGMMKEKDKD